MSKRYEVQGAQKALDNLMAKYNGQLPFLVNLTTHSVSIQRPKGRVFMPREELAAYVDRVHNQASQVRVMGEGGLSVYIPIYKRLMWVVHNLPPRTHGTYFVVSHFVADACADRGDLLVPLARLLDGKFAAGCTDSFTTEQADFTFAQGRIEDPYRWFIPDDECAVGDKG